jgi:NAD(P)-dependent dehydrogenase (short-subunit alcohol dehydrogenase family)
MENKTAIVTGGSSGIGLAICERLLEEGMQVHAISRNPDRMTKKDFLHSVELDLSDLDEVTRYGESFVEENGIPDLLVNNAGYGAFYEWKEFPEDEIIRQNTVLFSAPVLLCKAFAPLMAQSQKGTIVNITSLATLFPLPYMPLYNAGKSALSSFTQSLMLEYPEYPRLIDFRSGDVRTSFNRSAPKQAESGQSQSMKRAWKKIEDQLQDSPMPEVVVSQLINILKKDRSGVFYGGGFFQSRISPLLHRLLPASILRIALKIRYGLS